MPTGSFGGVSPQIASGTGEGGGAGEDEAVAAWVPSSTPVDDGPPLEDLEAQMGGELAARDAGAMLGAAPRPARRPAGRGVVGADDDLPAEVKNAPLPELDFLVGRLPPELRETMEELLRVRFVAVKRVPGRDLFNPLV